MRPVLVVMVKEPRPGLVKTRLGRDIGMSAAAWWYRHQTAQLLRQIRDPRWNLVLAVSPDREGLKSRVWPPDVARIAQGGGALGPRMQRLLAGFGPGAVCVIGSDIPGITRTVIADAFRALGQVSLVFGPAPDGGYWLIGAKGPVARAPGFLENVRWSSPHALHDSIASAHGVRIAQISSLADVDEATDLDRDKKAQ
ncbi:MAG: TIGR04282 family arsenosugar biosynthesis glycosyltransferase [Pseudomonadota bacterium]